MKRMRLAALFALWGGFIILVALLANLSLKACGIRILGHDYSWCVANRQPDVARLNDLQRQLHALIELNGQMGAQCGPALRSGVAPSMSLAQAGASEATSPPVGRHSAMDPSGDPVGLEADGDPITPGADGDPVDLEGDASGAPPSAPADLQGEGEPIAPEPDAADGLASPDATGMPDVANGEGAMPLPEPAPHKLAPDGAGGVGDGAGSADAGAGAGADAGAIADAGAGAGAGAGNPPPPPPSSGGQPSESKEPCEDGKPETNYVVLALDHSKSMGLPVDMDSDFATRLENIIEAGGPDAWKASNTYNDYIARPGRKRLDEVKASVGEVTRRLPVETKIGVVTFAGCNGVVDMGDYDQGRRARLMEKINRLETKPATPAADALKIAMEKASRVKGGRVILVSDGKDTCDADPCAVAKRSSGVQVDVISLGGGQALSCVAKATGGRLVEPAKQGQSLQQILVALGLNGGNGSCE